MTETRELRIYLISRTDEVDYDEDAASVVVAYSRSQARRIAAGVLDEHGSRSRGRNSFLDPGHSTVTQIGVHVARGGKPAEPHVVLTDYHVG